MIRKIKIVFLILVFINILCLSVIIKVNAHESLLIVGYDDCVDRTWDGENERWYYLSEKGYSAGPTYRYQHLPEEKLTLKYIISDIGYYDTTYTWTTDYDTDTAERIKLAFIESIKEWNDVYFYSYVNGNRIKNKVINIIEGTEEDYDLIIYPYYGSSDMAASVVTYELSESIPTFDVNYQHNHYNKALINVNLPVFCQAIYDNEYGNRLRKRIGQHEVGHILGLDDIDKCCPKSSEGQHHEEVLMGYGNNNTQVYDVTYKDIAGVAITRGFHTDADHTWMKRTNDNGTIDLICAQCNGVLYDVELDSNGTTYQGKSLNTYQSCVHYSGTNSNMLLVATDGERDFFKCQYCRYIKTIPIDNDLTAIGYNTNISVSNEIDSGKIVYTKLDITKNNLVDFTISSTNQLNVSLYDSNFNEININPSSNNTNTLEFSYNMLVGTYYLKVNFVNAGVSGTINLTINGEPHTHLFEKEYFNNSYHMSKCDCGEIGGNLEPHIILESQIINGRYAECLECHYLLDLYYDLGFGGLNSLHVTKVTINGSYILTNGIIILTDEDLSAYLDGSLVFYDKDKVPVLE